MKLIIKIGYKDIMSRFINQGSYGCIYSPAFPCERPDAVNSGNRISKIFKTKLWEQNDFYKTYNEEKAIYDNISPHLRSIDPHEEYFIYKYHQCKFKKSPYINDISTRCNDANTVFKSRPDIDYHWALNFSKGDRDLHNIIQSLPPDRLQYIALLKQLEHVIEGIHKLNKKGIYHLDIKPGNIVIQNNVLKIIDFGLCKKLHPSDLSHKHEIFRSVYEYWPIESLWLSDQLTPNMIDTHIRNYANKPYIRRLKSTFPDANITLSQIPLDDHRIYNNIDVWSFGMILYEVYKKMPNSMDLKINLSGMINRLISGPRQKSDDALKMYKLYIQHIIIPPSVWVSGRLP
jgi:serine/threonine protein kinase